jgi:acyl-CoA synthetase (AMP-forming)/AMP-acid ligase II
VLGAPDPVNGEVVGAFITVQPGARLAEEDVKAFCRRHMTTYRSRARCSSSRSSPGAPPASS